MGLLRIATLGLVCLPLTMRGPWTRKRRLAPRTMKKTRARNLELRNVLRRNRLFICLHYHLAPLLQSSRPSFPRHSASTQSAFSPRPALGLQVAGHYLPSSLSPRRLLLVTWTQPSARFKTGTLVGDSIYQSRDISRRPWSAQLSLPDQESPPPPFPLVRNQS